MSFGVIGLADTQKEIDDAIAALSLFPGKLARQSLRRAARTAGQYVLVKLRGNAPRAQTNLFVRSLAKKQVSNANKGIFMSIVGQKVSRSGRGKNKKESATSAFTVKQVARARSRNGGISTGISGQGKAVPIHFVSRTVGQHTIRPKNKKYMAANRTANNQPMPLVFWRRGVKHPGKLRVKGTDFVSLTAAQCRGPARRIYADAIRQDIPRIAAKLVVSKRKK